MTWLSCAQYSQTFPEDGYTKPQRTRQRLQKNLHCHSSGSFNPNPRHTAQRKASMVRPQHESGHSSAVQLHWQWPPRALHRSHLESVTAALSACCTAPSLVSIWLLTFSLTWFKIIFNFEPKPLTKWGGLYINMKNRALFLAFSIMFSAINISFKMLKNI